MPLAPMGLGNTAEWNNILSTGRKTVSASGTSERIATSGTGAGIILIQALGENTGDIILGGPLTTDAVWSATAASRRGIRLEPKQTFTLPLRETTSIWIDSQVSGEGIAFIIFG